VNTASGLDLLVCPADKASLVNEGEALRCTSCHSTFPIENGIPIFSVDPEWNDLYLNDVDHYVSEEPLQMVPGDEGYLALRGDENYGVLLDLGCGDGVFSSRVPARFISYCVDVTRVGLRRLQKRGKNNLIPVLASGFQLPFRDGVFDTVLYVFVVEHLSPDKDLQMLREIRRVVEETGKVIYTTDTPIFDRYIVRWTNLLFRFKWVRQDHVSETGHVNLLTMEQSRRLVRKAGFAIEAEHPYWMGTRFGGWMFLVSILRKVFPARICEDFLTSKYTFVLTRNVH
jgi:SAM-dependent methyltransferase